MMRRHNKTAFIRIAQGKGPASLGALYVQNNYDMLQEKYSGRVIAVAGQKVIAITHSIGSLFAKLERNSIVPNKDCYVASFPKSELETCSEDRLEIYLQARSKIEDFARKNRLSRVQLECLLRLGLNEVDHNDIGISDNQLYSCLSQTERGPFSREYRRLRRRNLIQKEVSRRDGKRTMIRLSEKGEGLYKCLLDLLR